FIIAKDCIQYRKNLLTASYVDDNMRSLENEIEKEGLLFLCEMGLDPGIDHMSAMKLLNHIRSEGGHVSSFRSHCGGLVAPESDDNPWRYKISWNPRNVVFAGKAGATFLENGAMRMVEYKELFDANRVVNLPELGYLAWYPNRDSLSYTSIYGLTNAETFVRTTLRFPEFCFGWKHIIDLKLTDETPAYNTDGMSLREFFRLHFEKHGFSDWLERQLMNKFQQTKELLEKMMQIIEAEEVADPDQRKEMQDFMVVDESGQLEDINLEKVKSKAAATVAGQVHEANLSIRQLVFLGMDDDETIINKGWCSAADVLQFSLENKLALGDDDKDMIVMLHEIGYEVHGVAHEATSELIVKGEDNNFTAMAKTVGLPLGIAAKLILQGKLELQGLRIPVTADIYEPVLAELALNGIVFQENIS
ncbi:MAG: hypothetical protein H7Y27_13625, partial [Gemmatimonadaceae bacterium]|nr:hypothetical protein [Chitinophagaceae bacterium]